MCTPSSKTPLLGTELHERRRAKSRSILLTVTVVTVGILPVPLFL